MLAAIILAIVMGLTCIISAVVVIRGHKNMVRWLRLTLIITASISGTIAMICLVLLLFEAISGGRLF